MPTNPYPVDSTTRPCCQGIGHHTRDCPAGFPADAAHVGDWNDPDGTGEWSRHFTGTAHNDAVTIIGLQHATGAIERCVGVHVDDVLTPTVARALAGHCWPPRWRLTGSTRTAADKYRTKRSALAVRPGPIFSFVHRGKQMPTYPRARDTDNSVTSGNYAMTPADAAAIASCLSITRIGRYSTACQPLAGEDRTVAALRLYRWNVEISAALMVLIHICEVAIRNAVSDAITSTHGPRWPWNAAFVRNLPARTGGYYSPRQDLITTAQSQPTIGKVIPELKFAFWESMFTSRHDGQIWNSQLFRVLPNASQANPAGQLRGAIRSDLGQIRILRNRIAHHEPIFGRQLADDLAKMRTLVEYRSIEMRTWLDAVESVTALIAAKP